MYQGLSLGTATAALLAALSPTPVRAEEIQLPTINIDADAEDFSATADAEALKGAGLSRADSAALLVNLPGITLQSGGALSGLPVIHGLADDRVRILIDGMTITSACPNHMNPAMSNIDPARIGLVDSFAGITPVSLGGDSIGGTIQVDPPLPLFATVQAPVLSTARLSTYFRSNTSGISVAGSATVATPSLSVTYDGAWTRDMDYHRGGDGEAVRATEAQRYDHNLTLGILRGSDLLTIRGGLQYTPYEGFPKPADGPDRQPEPVSQRTLPGRIRLGVA
jgi:iron complex outermembrane receptor protein